MRKTRILGLLVFGCALILLIPGLMSAQFGGGSGKKKGSFGFGGGGDDGNSIFDKYSNGGGSVSIDSFRMLRPALIQYAEDKGIRSGQLTRPQFLDFYEQYRAKLAGGMGFGKSGGPGRPPAGPGSGGPTGPGSGPPATDFGSMGKKKFDFGGGMPGMPTVPQGPVSANILNELADAQFKRLDTDGDGKLNQNEMPGPLRFGLQKYDKNSDGLIDLYEFREYFSARMVGSGEDSSTRNIASIIIEVEELDRKPVVYRPGGVTLAGLPAWFKELDTDKDGQVAMFEWRRGGSALEKHSISPDLDEFAKWDLDGDGYITPDEALRFLAGASNTPRTATLGSSGSRSSERPSNPWSGFGGFGKDKKDKKEKKDKK